MLPNPQSRWVGRWPIRESEPECRKETIHMGEFR